MRVRVHVILLVLLVLVPFGAWITYAAIDTGIKNFRKDLTEGANFVLFIGTALFAAGISALTLWALCAGLYSAYELLARSFSNREVNSALDSDFSARI